MLFLKLLPSLYFNNTLLFSTKCHIQIITIFLITKQKNVSTSTRGLQNGVRLDYTRMKTEISKHLKKAESPKKKEKIHQTKKYKWTNGQSEQMFSD